MIENDGLNGPCDNEVLLPEGFCRAMPHLKSVEISNYWQRQHNEMQNIHSDGQSDSEESE
jgi:hypothetical protein